MPTVCECYMLLYHHRQCASVVAVGDSVYEALLPAGHIVKTVLQYVWTLWEDPVDVGPSPLSLFLPLLTHSPHPLPSSLSSHLRVSAISAGPCLRTS